MRSRSFPSVILLTDRYILKALESPTIKIAIRFSGNWCFPDLIDRRILYFFSEGSVSLRTHVSEQSIDSVALSFPRAPSLHVDKLKPKCLAICSK